MLLRFDNGGKMNCHQVLEQLSAFHDNELLTDETNALKAHLIRCPTCRQKRSQLEEMGRHVRNLQPLTAPEDFQFRIYSAIRRRESGKNQSRFLGWRTVLIPAAAMIVGVFIGLSTNSFISPTGTDSPLTASDKTVDETILAFSQSEDDVIRDYSLDRYIQGSLIPVNVESIPEAIDGTPRVGVKNQAAETRVDSIPQYVLDNIPMRVNYERTIY